MKYPNKEPDMLFTNTAINESEGIKYLQVSRLIEDMIRQRKLKPGEKLPSDRDIAEMLKLTPVTVGKGLQVLMKKKLLARRPGAGTFVTDECNAPVKNCKIGIFLHDRPIPNDWYVSTVINEFYDFWEKRGSEIMVMVKRGGEYRRAIDENGLSGIAVIAPEAEFLPEIQSLQESKFPIVSVGYKFPEIADYSFGTDHELVAKNAVEYLTGLGYEKIGIIMPNHKSLSADCRLRGYNKGMWNAKLPVNPDWIISQDGGKPLPELLNEKIDHHLLPEAFLVVSCNDIVPFYQAMNAKKIAIPDDVSVIAFDDYPVAGTMQVPVTVLAQPVDKIANAAAMTLKSMIYREERPMLENMCPFLIERKSCIKKR